MANLYAEVEKVFTILTVDGNLIFSLGGDGAATHQANLVFVNDIKGSLSGPKTVYDIDKFLTIVKMGTNNPMSIKITSRGVLVITISTNLVDYSYYLRAKRD